MKLDHTHRTWLFTVVVLTLAGGALYGVYAIRSPQGPRGDTPIGLSFGILAAALSLFAGALAVRKYMLLLRVGSVTSWMRGHLWLGALVLPLACYHGGFKFGGLLTTVLMGLMIVVVVTGLFGAVLQHTLPPVMTAQLPGERTYEQLDRIRWNLRSEAYETVAAVCGRIPEAEGERTAIEAALGAPPRERKTPPAAAGVDAIRTFYASHLLALLGDVPPDASPLAGSAVHTIDFDDLRVRVDASLQPAIDRLASLCAASLNLRRQTTLHRWLHGWLLVHVPASIAFLILMVVHAFAALYY
jgi:hypothetical protein